MLNKPLSSLDTGALLQQLSTFVDLATEIMRQNVSCKHLAEELAGTKLNIRSPFTMAIVGQMRLGKSTLVNSLINDDKALVGMRETTATVNWIRHDDGALADRFRVTWNTLPPTTELLPLSELERWSGDSSLAARTRYLELFSRAGFLKHVQVIDTPGARSVIEQHQETLQQFLSAAKRCEDDTHFYGGVADCLVYVLSAVGKESDSELLDRFSSETRIPGSSAYNSIGVVHKWEAVIEADEPWDVASRKATQLRNQFRRHLSDVVAVSGPLHRIAGNDDAEYWNQVVKMASSLDEQLDRLLLTERRYLEADVTQSDWKADRRRVLFERYRSILPWDCYRVMLLYCKAKRIHDGAALRAAISDLAGVNRLMDLLDARFFSRSQVIRAARQLKTAIGPCDRAIGMLRKMRLRHSDHIDEAREALLELSDVAESTGKARNYIARTSQSLARQQSIEGDILHKLESCSHSVRSAYLRFDDDLHAMRMLDENPGLFDEEDLLEIMTILGAYGHSLENRCGVFPDGVSDVQAIEKQTSKWIRQCQMSAGIRRTILEKLVARLTEMIVTFDVP